MLKQTKRQRELFVSRDGKRTGWPWALILLVFFVLGMVASEAGAAEAEKGERPLTRTQMFLNDCANIFTGGRGKSSEGRGSEPRPTGRGGDQQWGRRVGEGGEGRLVKDYRPETVLDEEAVNLTKLASEGAFDDVAVDTKLIQRILVGLMSPKTPNVMLVADAGVGKSMAIRGFARVLFELSNLSREELVEKVKGEWSGVIAAVVEFEGKTPDEVVDLVMFRRKMDRWKDRVVYDLEFADLMKNGEYRGSIEGKVRAIIEAMKMYSNVIVVFDEAHLLAKSGGSGDGMALLEMFKQVMTSGESHMLLATTKREYRINFSNDTAIRRRSLVVVMDVPTKEQAFPMLRAQADNLERLYGIEVSDGAIEAAIDLAVRYNKELALPSSAVRFLELAVGRQALAGLMPPDDLVVMAEKIEDLGREVKKFEDQGVDSLRGGERLEYNRLRAERNGLVEQFVPRMSAFNQIQPISVEIDNNVFKLENVREQIKKLRSELKDSDDLPTPIHNDKVDQLKELKEDERSITLEIAELKKERASSVRGQGINFDVVEAHHVLEAVAEQIQTPVEQFVAPPQVLLARMLEQLEKDFPGQEELAKSVLQAQSSHMNGFVTETPSVLLTFSDGGSAAKLARSIAESRFGDREAVVEVDMAASGNHATALFGHQNVEARVSGGRLLMEIKDKPRQVIVLQNAHMTADGLLVERLSDMLTKGQVDVQIEAEMYTVNTAEAVIIVNAPVLPAMRAATEDGVSEVVTELESAERREKVNMAAKIIGARAGKAGVPFSDVLKQAKVALIIDSTSQDYVTEVVVTYLEQALARLRQHGVYLKLEPENFMALAEVAVGAQGTDIEELKWFLREYLVERISDKLMLDKIQRGDILEPVFYLKSQRSADETGEPLENIAEGNGAMEAGESSKPSELELILRRTRDEAVSEIRL